MKHLLKLGDLSTDEIGEIIDLADDLKHDLIEAQIEVENLKKEKEELEQQMKKLEEDMENLLK